MAEDVQETETPEVETETNVGDAPSFGLDFSADDVFDSSQLNFNW
jgi:hypothetical protein